MKKTFRFVGVLLALLLSVSGCGGTEDAAEQKVSKSDFYFDTVITITLYGTDDAAAIDGCFALAADYEKKFSNTVEDSEVSRINAAAGKESVTVSDETIALLQEGIAYGEESGGMFDITVGALSDLWNISEISAETEEEDHEAEASVLPDDTAVQSALSHVDYRALQIEGNDVYLTDEAARLDLGGIAKGYIADRMKEYLNEQGFTSGIINLGGNVLTLGEKADKSTYSIGIQKPFAADGTAVGAVYVTDKSVVTSGVYERYYTVDGKRYHHILDLSTGYPCENDLYSVTIISDSSVDGDALSTTCFVLGLDEGMALIESLEDVEAIFITDDNEIHLTSGFGDTVQFSEL